MILLYDPYGTKSLTKVRDFGSDMVMGIHSWNCSHRRSGRTGCGRPDSCKDCSIGSTFLPLGVCFPFAYVFLGHRPNIMLIFGVPGHVASLLVRFSLTHKGELPYGWAPRILIQCGVPHGEIWEIFNEMYESQVSRPSLFITHTESHRSVALGASFQ